MMNAQRAPAPSQSKRSFEPSAPSSAPAHASKQQGHALRLNWYRGFYRLWLLFGLLWVAATGFEICRQYSEHRHWQVVHDDWKRRYAEWEKTPGLPGIPLKVAALA
jgi:hypothetical protein